MKKIIAMTIIIVGLVTGLVFQELANPGNSCTIFTVQDGDQVLFNSNEDWHSGELYLGFSASNSGANGVMRIGYLIDGTVNFQSAINDQGLAWAINSVPSKKLEYDSGKKYDIANDNFFSMLSDDTATVAEAVALAQEFKFWDEMAMQIHIADKTGAAVVISPGADGKLAYTWKEEGDGNLISTNFNRAIPSSGYQDGRYETVAEMLQNRNDQDLAWLGADILEKVSLHTLTTFTMISSVTDLTNGETMFFYMSQFNEAAQFNMFDEIKKGDRIISMREMFSAATVAAGDKDYQIGRAHV